MSDPFEERQQRIKDILGSNIPGTLASVQHQPGAGVVYTAYKPVSVPSTQDNPPEVLSMMNREDYDMCLHHLDRIQRLVNQLNSSTNKSKLQQLIGDIQYNLKESLNN